MTDFTTTGLLTRTRLKAGITSGESDYSDATILDICDQQMADMVVPLILETNGDYYLTYVDYSLVESRRKYAIPSRAYNAKLHSLYWLNTSKDQHRYIGYIDQRNVILGQDGYPTRHTINDNSIVLYHGPSNSTEYLRVYYHYRPSVLVATTEVLLATGVGVGATSTVFAGSVDAGWTTSDTYDVVNAESPYELINSDLTATAVSAGISITFDTTDVDADRLATGTYYVTKAGETCVPTIPQSMHYVFADLAACAILEQLRDEGWEKKRTDSIQRLASLISTIIPRKDTEFKQWFSGPSALEYRCL